MRASAAATTCLLATALVTGACDRGPAAPGAPTGADAARPATQDAAGAPSEGAPGLPAIPVTFTDVTQAAGIRFTHTSGRTGRKYLPETLGAGVAFTDLDGDGWSDLVFVNGRSWSPGGRRTTAAFYRNDTRGGFVDRTAGSGLDVPLYGMGIAAADYDGDGRADLYLTALDGDRLFHNEGGGRFRDVTAAAGIRNASFGTSAAWLDYDRDGHPDVFVANYVRWSEKDDLWCSIDGATKSYCTPESYPGTASVLYRNLGNGRFADVSREAGVSDPTSKSLGVATLDYDGDGWVDLFVANDTQPNKLYRNNGNGTFADHGIRAGVAYSEDGVARGAMGADAADFDGSGRPHLLVGNFSNQMLGLYHNEGQGLFVDEAPRSIVGRASLLSLTFGVFFFDYDLDGGLDILAANGHIEEEIARVQPTVQYKQAPLLLRNSGGGSFEDASRAVGAAFTRPIVGRGAAYADYDHDGDLDVVLTSNDGPATLFRNDGGSAHAWLGVHVEGTTATRDGLGAIVRVRSGAGAQWQMVRSGSSYASESDRVLRFGLGRDQAVSELVVEWPGGGTDRLTDVASNRIVTIRQSSR